MAAYDALNLEQHRAVGAQSAVNTGLYIQLFGCLLALGVLFFGLAAAAPVIPVVVVAGLVFFACGFAALAAGMYILMQGHGQRSRVVDKGIDLLDLQIKREMATPAALPEPAPTTALPPDDEPDAFVWNHSGVGEVVPKDLIAGFDPRFIDWLLDYLLGKGNRWSEAALENMPVPYEGGVFGKAEGTTPYQRLFGLPDGVLVKAGIIVGRGGPGNATGKLGMATKEEMRAALKQVA